MNETLIDRTKKPESTGVGEIPFSFPQKYALKNGDEMFVYQDFDSEVLRVEFQFDAGISHSNNRLEAIFTNNLIASGTSELSAKEISEKIDF